MKPVHNEQAERVFPRLRAALVENDMFDEMNAVDEAYLNDVIGALLVTGPIDEGSPFSVETSDSLGNVDPMGQGFDVHAVQVTPHSNMYDVQFVAVSSEQELVYEFDGRVRNSEPALVVQTAEMRQFSGRLDVPFE